MPNFSNIPNENYISNQNIEVLNDIVDNRDLISKFSELYNYSLENNSFALIRTNPKLTTNVKLIVDSSGKMFLESFDANEELSKSNYKAFRISNESSYEYDLMRFYNNGDTPSDIIFENKRESSDLSVKDNYGIQFEMEYTYGTEAINSKKYDEELGIHAPIWLEKQIPEYFVIFRLDEPISLKNITGQENENFDELTDVNMFKDLILKKSKIIKTFDLSENSEIGKYLRKYRNNKNFPISPLTFNAEQDSFSKWNGIDLKNGGFISKNEDIYSQFFEKDKTILENDYLLTGGFERNKVALSNIINLEFLFDDNEVEKYSINRYFGFYVNTIEEGEFQVDGVKLYNDFNSNQYPKLNGEQYLSKFNTKDILQTNKNGIKFYIDNDSIKSNYLKVNNLTDADFLPDSTDVSNLLSVFYVKDKFGNLHNLKMDSNWKHKDELRINSTNINWKDFTGEGNLIISTVGKRARKNINKSSVLIEINGPLQQGDEYFATIIKKQVIEIEVDEIITLGDNFEIKDANNNTLIVTAANSNPLNLLNKLKNAWNSQTTGDFTLFNASINNGKLLIFEKNESGIQKTFNINTSGNNKFELIDVRSADLTEFTIIADSSLAPIGKSNERIFNPNGSPKEIAKSIASAFNFIKNRFYTAIPIKNKIVLISNLEGERFNDISIGRNKFMLNSNLLINSNTDGIQHPIFEIKKFEGATDNYKSKISVDIETYNTFIDNDIYLQVVDKTLEDNKLSKVLNVSNYIDEPIYDKLGNIIGFKDFEKYCTVIVDKNEEIYLDNYNKIYLFDLYKIKFGRLSFLEIMDFDFDTLSEEYSNMNSLDYEKDFYTNIMNFSKYQNNFNGLLLGKHPEIYKFFEDEGFSSLISQLNIENIDNENVNTFIKSEYERLHENYIKELSIPSRISPTIAKWVFKNGKNIRNKDYRLTSSEAFGLTNFSPSKDSYTRDSTYYTQEWYYLQKIPWYFSRINDLDENSITSYFSNKFDVSINGIMSTSYNYFDEYFIVDNLSIPEYSNQGNPMYDNLINGYNRKLINKQLRYSKVDYGNNEIFSHCLHKGIKVMFKERAENNININYNINEIKFLNSTRFNDYKFSTVLIPHTGEYPIGKKRKTIEYEFIENRKYKNITFIVYLKIDDNLQNINLQNSNINEQLSCDFIDYSMLYSFDSSISTTNPDTILNISYNDVKLSGVPDLLQFTNTSFLNKRLYGTEDLSGQNTQFLTEILLNENGAFNKLNLKIANHDIDFVIDEIVNDYFIKISGAYVHGTNINQIQPQGLQESIVRNADFTYLSGGYQFWKSRLEDVSFAKIYELINNGDPNVKYITVLEDGTIKNNLFAVELQTGKEIIKPSYVKSVTDDDKPVKFNTLNLIGYKIQNDDNVHLYPINRHISHYQPKFNKIVEFEDPYILTEFNENNKYLQFYFKMRHLNSQFKINDDFFKLKNFYYHKTNDVNSSGILELSENDSHHPLYPYINEIAIDKRDMYLWESNWNPGYFRKHIDKHATKHVIGSRSTIEKKSFFGSKVMKIENEIILDDFISHQITDINEIDNITEYFKPDNDIELTYYSDKSIFILNMFLEKRLNRYFNNSNVRNTFINYIKPILSYGDINTIDDDIISYVKNNILDRFTLDSIDLYLKKSSNNKINSIFNELESNMSLNQKIKAGLIKDNNISINTIPGTNKFNIKLIYNKTVGTYYVFSPTVKIIKR